MTHATVVKLGYHELLEAFPDPGCAVCRRAEEAVDDAIRGILHEHVNDAGFRAELHALRGFCHAHAWRLVRQHGRLHDLDELIRKQDYRFAHEPDTGEAHAWMRAVAAVNGLDVRALARRRSAKLPPNKKRDWRPG